ncbi:MAG TPA: hemerythrin domain-containing protein [Candidatus Binatia bacterium]|nr:hemerythrin domain-containing protein [Candidatus Binatia bacterium]
MRHPSLVPLSHDHHHGLALALRCRKQALGQIKPMGTVGLKERAHEARLFFANHLVDHFRAEEDVLFPTLGSLVAASAPIIDQLLQEHEQIRCLALQLETEPGLGKRLFDFGDLLEGHIRKEERELFPLFEQHVGAKDAEIAAEQIRKILGTDARGS